MTEPLPDTADVVVVGGGVMGASIAFHLAARGAGDVLLLERDVVCSGPTRHSTAIVRLHYTQPLLVRMAAHGLRVYRAFAEIVGSSAGFTRSGMLFGVDPRDREMLAGNVAVGQAEGVETHLVDHETVAEIDGRVIAEDLEWCYEPGAGHCDPYRVTAGFAFAAGRSGARLAEGVRVTAVRDGGVSTDAGDVAAGTVVVAAGPWSAPLLAPLGYDLPVTPARAEVARFRLPAGFGGPPPAVADFSAAQLYFRGDGDGFLEVGSLDPRHGEQAVDPDEVPEGAERETVRAYHESLVRRLRGADQATSAAASPASTTSRRTGSPRSAGCPGRTASSSRPGSRATGSSSRPRSGRASPSSCSTAPRRASTSRCSTRAASSVASSSARATATPCSADAPGADNRTGEDGQPH